MGNAIQITGTAACVLGGIVLFIGPWIIHAPASILGRIGLSLIGGVLVWFGCMCSKG